MQAIIDYDDETRIRNSIDQLRKLSSKMTFECQYSLAERLLATAALLEQDLQLYLERKGDE